jgi:hypothetical protein
MTWGKPGAQAPSAARRIIDAILADFRDRSGFDHAWDGTDDDIQQEIRAAWVAAASAEIAPIEDRVERLRAVVRDLLAWDAERPATRHEDDARDLWKRARVALAGEDWDGR